MEMNLLSYVFLLCLFGGLALEFLLGLRQRRHILKHRPQVPQDFAASISLNEHQKAADYSRAKVGLRLAGVLVATVLTLLWTFGGALQWLDDALRHLSPAPIAGLLFLLSFLLIAWLLDMPLSLYRIFGLEQSFGFNRMTPGLVLADTLKQAFLFLAIGAPLIQLVLWLMARPDSLWWLWTWALYLSFSILMMWIYPAFIAPLFNTFRPLDNPALEKRIIALLARNGFTSRGLFVMDGSTRSTHGNAYFTGLGAHKRIVFFDTLIAEMNDDEIEAVLAHELGHFKCQHIIKRIAIMALVSFAALAVLGWLRAGEWFYTGLGVSQPSDHQALALFILLAPVFLQLLQPLFAWISRCHEFEADRFAAGEAHSTDLISALIKLYRENANTLTPDPWYSACHDSHPPATQRIARLQNQPA